MRVLIVDDKEDNVYYLTTLLSAHGCLVESARHGAEALVKARRSPPALVISDLLMPVMDGYTLLRHWKADGQLRSVPFIVYTATYTAPQDERLALDMGADAFILKPTEPEEFLARLREVEQRAAVNAPAGVRRPDGDDDLLRAYSETLIHKLEEKTLQLEESYRRLQQDVAAREQAEVALRESEARFRQLAESIDDVFWLSDPDKREFYYVSPAYETVWGRTCESLYAAPGSWLDAVHSDDRERVRASLVREGTGTYDETYRIVRPDGAIRWIRARAYPVRDAAGRVYRLAGVSRDVTEYRRLEEQFRHAQKLEAVGQLAGGVAHDFNNLLAVIVGYANLALESIENGEPIRADVEEIRRAAERAAMLTRQLLAFSRKQILQPRVLDLGRVVLDVEKMLRRILGVDVELVLNLSRPTSRVHADPSQLEQILLNLVVNARDAMPRGGRLTIDLRDVELDEAYAAQHPGVVPGCYAMLAVSDTGVGMDAATRERIFEPFFTTKEIGKGTGLGLSTVFGIVRQSGGHIVVESEPGEGATFRVYLPCTDRAVEAESLPPPTITSLRGSETILLVEDDEQVRNAHRAILQRNGYRVLDAQNAGEAFLVSEKFRDRIHLLLTDVIMPRMSGCELAERIAQSRPDMRVLYLSGYSVDSPTRRGALVPATDFLPKPSPPVAFLRKVREVLSASS